MKTIAIKKYHSPKLSILHEKPISDKLKIKTSTHLHLIAKNEIIYLQALGNYTKIYTEKEGMICSSKTLKYYENQLKDRCFLRPHQSYIINICKVRKIAISSSGTITMNNKVEVPLSRSRKAKFMEVFQ